MSVSQPTARISQIYRIRATRNHEPITTGEIAIDMQIGVSHDPPECNSDLKQWSSPLKFKTIVFTFEILKT